MNKEKIKRLRKTASILSDSGSYEEEPLYFIGLAILELSESIERRNKIKEKNKNES